MAFDYLKALSLTREQEAKLRALGSRSASSLLSRIEYAPEKFALFFGEEETQRIRSLLKTMVPEEEKAQLSELPTFRGKFGAKVISKDESSTVPPESSRREQLMRQIRMIRESGASSEKARALLEDLENDFRKEIKSTTASGS
jgi:hypothetical protein